MKHIWFALCLLLLIGCSESSDKTNTSDHEKESYQQAERVSILIDEVQNEKTENLKDNEYEVIIDSTLLRHVQFLDSTYDKSPYYFKDGDEIYFYVIKGKWPKENIEHNFPKGNFKIGLVTKSGKVILKPYLDKIYNPGVLEPSIMEVELDGKIGLINYKTLESTSIKYDLIFPSIDSKYIAFGQTGDQKFGITHDLVEKEVDNELSYHQLVKMWDYNALDKRRPYLYDSYAPFYLNDANEGRGVSFTPSVLNRLKALPEMYTNLINDEANFGVDGAEIAISDAKTTENGFTAFISEFFESGADGRGYQITKYHLHTTDEMNKNIDDQELISTETYYTNACIQHKTKIEFINNSLIRVPTVVQDPIDYAKIQGLTLQKLYEITETGEIKELVSNRVFDFTKFTFIDDTYFVGCFSSHLPNEHIEDYEGQGSLLLWDHLDTEDLDVMRNEIFAEYGYKFKSEKWQNYFSKFPWYNPQHENVEEFLSEIDKYNIDVILKVKKRIQNNPKIVNKRKEPLMVAG